MILMVKSSKLAVCIAVFAHFAHFCHFCTLHTSVRVFFAKHVERVRKPASALRSAEQMAALEAKKATESANANESGLGV